MDDIKHCWSSAKMTALAIRVTRKAKITDYFKRSTQKPNGSRSSLYFKCMVKLKEMSVSVHLLKKLRPVK